LTSSCSAKRITELTEFPPASTRTHEPFAAMVELIAFTSHARAAWNALISVSRISGLMSEGSEFSLTAKRLLSVD
jgi:hypothetical protein